MSGFHNALRYIFKASKLLKTALLCHSRTIESEFSLKTIHFLMVSMKKYQKIKIWEILWDPSLLSKKDVFILIYKKSG